jgi:hypothetical protein
MKKLGKRLLPGFLAAALITGMTGIHPAWGQDEEAKKKILEIGRWYPSVESGLNITQSSYSENWFGGDKGSIVWTFITNADLENKLSRKVHWTNALKLAYGQTHQQRIDERGDRSWDRPEKSTDLIDFETLFRFTLEAFVDPFVSGRLETQFQDASDPLGRNLPFNPLKFKESAGIARQFFDEEDRSLLTRLGFTFRQTSRKIFKSETDPTDDETTTEMSNDGGIEWITDYKTKILEERVTWTSKLSLYQPFFYSGDTDFDKLTSEQLETAGVDTDVKDFAKVVDIDWENIFTTQITKLISVQLYLRWLYDKYDNSVPPVFNDEGEWANPVKVRQAIRKSGQFKQTLSLGITYRFL